MSLPSIKIEHHMCKSENMKSGTRKFLKNMRNRKIRRVPVDKDIEHKKYDGYEY